MSLRSVCNDVGLIRKPYSVINSGDWSERIEVWIVRHKGRRKFLVNVVIGLHKGLCMSGGGIDETQPLGQKCYTSVKIQLAY